MAIVRVASETSTSASSSTLVLSLATQPTAGNILLVAVSSVDIGGGAATFTVTDNQSNSYSALTGTRATLNDSALEIFRATSLSTGSPFTVTVTASATQDGMAASFVEYSGTDESAGIESSSATVASGTALAAGSVNPGAGVTALYFAHMAHELSPAATSVDAPFTQFLGGGAGDGRSTHDLIGANEAENPNVTWTGALGAMHAVAVIDEAVAAVGPIMNTYRRRQHSWL